MNDENYSLKNLTIMELARQDLLTNGIRKFSVDLFASQHHISKKTIYQAFSSKEELINNVLLYHFESLFQEVAAIPDQTDQPLKQVFLILKTIMNTLARINPQFTLEIKLYYPQIWQRVEQLQNEIINRIINCLSRAQELGQVRPDLDLHFVAILIIRIAQNTFQPEFFIQTSYSISDLVRLFTDLVINGMLSSNEKFYFNELA